MRVVLHTRLADGDSAAYDRVHAQVPRDLEGALRRAGVTAWTIWRTGADLFHLLEVDDFDAMQRQMADEPANVEWQRSIEPLMAQPVAPARPLMEVWRLPPASGSDSHGFSH